MVLAEKLFQKLNNLKSKEELKDFFIYFDDNRELRIKLEDGKISNTSSPTEYIENSEGKFLIVWDDEYISEGDLSCACIGDFEEFFKLTKRIKIKCNSKVFIPEKGIYPMVIAYSKSLADMISLPEYLLKIADVAHELNRMVKLPVSSTIIRAKEGTKHVFSSRQLDENYPYTVFYLNDSLNDKFRWSITMSEAFPIVKLEAVFRFFGNICNVLNTEEEHKLDKSQNYDVILSPDIFRELFTNQVLDQLKGRSILNKTGIFNVDSFKNREKHFGTLSLSYDPLLNHKVGTYRFTSFGLKAKKQYFIKYGKLDTPILNALDYSQLGYEEPTIEVCDFGNLKFEGIKKHTFESLTKTSSNTIFAIAPVHQRHASNVLSELKFNEGVLIHGKKLMKCSMHGIKVSILQLLKENRLELVEFVDGQYGCKISNIQID